MSMTHHLSLTARLGQFIIACACLLLTGTHADARTQHHQFRLTLENTVRGIELYQQGNAKEAIKLFKKSVKHDNSDAD